MDPALQELLASGEADDEIEVVVRLRDGAEPPPALRLVSRFGPIATARIERAAIRQVYGDPALISIKAPRWLVSEDDYGPLISVEEAEYIELEHSDLRRPTGLPQTGRGTLIGIIDWGCDFAHPDFIDGSGNSRLLALWDQPSGAFDGNRYGYGRVLQRPAIDAALKSDDPYRALRYHPARSDSGIGAHGTHVMGIAAGNGRGGGPFGMAPEAALIFVQLGRPGWERNGPLGDSGHLLDALHFIVEQAGERPLAINMSIGRHAGPHDGSTLVEQAIDWILRARPGTAIVQSTGNYYARDVHCTGRLWNGAVEELRFEVRAGDSTPNEVEVWYPGHDVFGVSLVAPNGDVVAETALGGSAAVEIDGVRVGTLYHRARDPNNGDHHINLFQYPTAPSGQWRLRLHGEDVSDGRYHAWIERDPGCSVCQALFDRAQVDRSATTGSICNSLQTIAVGAYDGHHPDWPLAPFSSSGPTRDGRLRPLLLAPGVRVLAARSQSLRGDSPRLTRMSGTSMAAPHVTGTIALMFEAAGRLDIVRLRRALFDSLQPVADDDPIDPQRCGLGRLDAHAAVQRAAALAAIDTGAPRSTASRSGSTANADEAMQDIAASASGRSIDAAVMTVAVEGPTADAAEFAVALLDMADAEHCSSSIEPIVPATAVPAPADGDITPIPASFESEEVTAMNADCCGEACQTCEHCEGQPCASCPCCHDLAAESVESDAVIQVVPSPLPASEPGALPIEAGAGDEPVVQVVPSPLTAGGAVEWQEEQFDEVAVETEAIAAEHQVHCAEASAEQADVAFSDVAHDCTADHAEDSYEDSYAEASEFVHPVEAAEALVHAGIDDATEFVAESLANAGRRWPAGASVRQVYDDLTGRASVAARRRMERRFELVGRPGRPLSLDLQTGDLVIRRGDRGFACAAFVAHPWLYREHEARAHGLRMETAWPGLYAHVVEPGARPQQGHARLARRICRSDGSLLANTLVLRLREAAEFDDQVESAAEFDPAEAGPDPGVRWLQQALNRAINAGLVVDGLGGPATRAAVQRYQQARGLTVDGIVGPQTLGALRAEYGVSAPPAGYGTPPYAPPPGYTPPPPPTYQRPPSYTPPPPPATYQRPPTYTPPPTYRQPPTYTPPPPPAYQRPPVYTPPPPPAYQRPPIHTPPPPPTYQRPPTHTPPPPTFQRPPYPQPRPPQYRPPGYPPPAYPPPAGYAACRALVRFGYDSSQLTTTHRAAIAEAAQRIVAAGSRSVTVTGYASPEGSAAYNLALGQRRADAVGRALREAIERVRAGAAAQIRFDLRSAGESRPVAGDAAAQRRVEICYQEARETPPRPQPPGPRPPGPRPQPPRPRPPVQPQLLVRHDAASPQGQNMLTRFEDAVRRMQALPASDPRSWTFQWYTHAVRSDRTRAQELTAAFGSGNSPARALAERMWNTCRAHFDSNEILFFLPWHRMYVYYLERICRRLLGDDSFTLPYWNYSSGSALLPAPFRNPASPLFRAERNPGPNQGRPIDQGQAPGALSASRALARPNYATQGNDEGFNEFLDSDPHGPVHVMVGDRDRGMGTIAWAARDPIFWLHHANIDRIWASWNAAGRRNPTDASFLDRTFSFADENGQAVTARVRDFLDPAVRGYRYAALESVPARSAAELAEEAEPGTPDRPTRSRIMARRSTVAPTGGIPLGGNAIRINLGRLQQDAETVDDEAGTAPRRVYLVIRNMRANVQPGVVYHVYLALPAGTGGQAAQQHYVGPLSFFDAVPMPGHGAHAGGKTRRFEITAIADRLRAAGMLDDNPSVTIAPAGQPAASAQPVIGEISFVEE